MNLPIDLPAIKTFLKAFSGGKLDTYCIQTFGENGNQCKPLHKTGSLENLTPFIEQCSRNGQGIFFAVNETDGKGRSLKNIKKVRAFVADFDDSKQDNLTKINNLSLPPNIIVNSSPKKYHAYWLVSNCPLNQYKHVQQAIAKKLDSDKNVCDLSRVMRLPGTYHRKGEPHLVTADIRVRSIPDYSFIQVVKGLGLDINEHVDRYEKADTWTKTAVSEYTGPDDDDELIEKLRLIQPSVTQANNRDRATFSELFDADTNALKKHYPCPRGERDYDPSAADAALCQHLAFGTGRNCERILRLMRRSRLVREKWNRPAYLTRTIERAVSLQDRIYRQRPNSENILNSHDPALITTANSFSPFSEYKIVANMELVGEDLPDALTLLSSGFKNRLQACSGLFHWWNGRCWESVDDRDVRRAIGFPLMSAQNKATQSRVKGILEAMRDHAKPIQELDPPTSHVYFLNGVFHISSGQLKAHDYTNYNTRTLATNYDSHAECSQWLDWLSSTFQSEPERISLLQEILGWMLCRDNLGIEKAALFVGPPRAGKGIISRILQEALGNGASSFRLNDLDNPKTLSAMRGKNVAIDPDAVSASGRNGRSVMGLFKVITSNDRINLPLLYTQTPWEGSLSCKLLVLANSIPSMWDDSAATGNRWIPLKFDQSYLGNEDPNLFSRLSKELPGITLWATKGLTQLAQRGRFDLPQSSCEQLETLVSDGGSIQAFIEEQLIISKDERSSDSELWDRYCLWATNNGYDIGKRIQILKSVEDALRGREARRVKSVKLKDGRFCRGFYGVGILPTKQPNHVTPHHLCSR